MKTAPDRSIISNWMIRFAAGRVSLKDDPRSGASVKVTKNVEVVRQLLNEDRRLTFDELQVSTGYSWATLHGIIHDTPHMNKISAKWVPRLLTDEQKATKVQLSIMSLAVLEELGDLFWEGSSPLMRHLFPTSCQRPSANACSGWRPESRGLFMPKQHLWASSKPPCFGTAKVWSILTIAHLVSPSQVHTIANCCKLFTTSCRKFAVAKFNDPCFCRTNARVHTVRVSMQKISDLKWQLLPNPPYSPDLAPSDFHLFKSMKDPLRGIRFTGEREIKRAVKESLVRYPKEWFTEGMKVAERWHQWVDKEGDYVEKWHHDVNELLGINNFCRDSTDTFIAKCFSSR